MPILFIIISNLFIQQIQAMDEDYDNGDYGDERIIIRALACPKLTPDHKHHFVNDVEEIVPLSPLSEIIKHDPLIMVLYQKFMSAQADPHQKATFDTELHGMSPKVQNQFADFVLHYQPGDRQQRRANILKARQLFLNVLNNPQSSQEMVSYAYLKLSEIASINGDEHLASLYSYMAKTRHQHEGLYQAGIQLYENGGKLEAWSLLMLSEKMGYKPATLYLDYIFEKTGDFFIIHQKLRLKAKEPNWLYHYNFMSLQQNTIQAEINLTNNIDRTSNPTEQRPAPRQKDMSTG